MVDLIREAVSLQQFLLDQGWKFCFIGGIAVQAHGEPRLTRDLDLSVLTGFGREESYVDALLARYKGRLTDSREFALQRRILLLSTPAGVAIDLSLAALPFEEEMMARANDVEFLTGSRLRVCSPEDLIVMKVFAGRELDRSDARSVVIRQQHLDWAYIERQLAVLEELRGEPGLAAMAKALRAT